MNPGTTPQTVHIHRPSSPRLARRARGLSKRFSNCSTKPLLDPGFRGPDGAPPALACGRH